MGQTGTGKNRLGPNRTYWDQIGQTGTGKVRVGNWERMGFMKLDQ